MFLESCTDIWYLLETLQWNRTYRKLSTTIRCKAKCFPLACKEPMLTYVGQLLQTFGDTSLVTLKCFDMGISKFRRAVGHLCIAKIEQPDSIVVGYNWTRIIS